METVTLTIKRAYNGIMENMTVCISTANGEFFIKNGAEIEITLPKGNNEIIFKFKEASSGKEKAIKKRTYNLAENSKIELNCQEDDILIGSLTAKRKTENTDGTYLNSDSTKLILISVVIFILFGVIFALFGRLLDYIICEIICIGFGIFIIIKDDSLSTPGTILFAIVIGVILAFLVILMMLIFGTGGSSSNSDSCGVCGGSGYVPTDGWGFTTCPLCKGSGVYF